jgi:hypothetical protein
MTRYLQTVFACTVLLLVSACATAGPKDYSAFRADSPRSILVVPVVNNSASTTAPEYFLSTLSQPFAERGYYVFPAHMIKRTLEDNGLADPGLIHSADPRRLQNLFGCSAILLVNIDKWESQYLVLATSTNVEFKYTLKSCQTGIVLWEHTQALSYNPSGGSSGNLLVDLISDAVVAALEKADPNYLPLARQANALAVTAPGQGIPAGPYRPAEYQKDTKEYPTGTP